MWNDAAGLIFARLQASAIGRAWCDLFQAEPSALTSLYIGQAGANLLTGSSESGVMQKKIRCIMLSAIAHCFWVKAKYIPPSWLRSEMA